MFGSTLASLRPDRRGGVTNEAFVTLHVVTSERYSLSVLEHPTDPELDDAAPARRIANAAPTTDPDAESALYRRLAPRVRLYGLKHLRDEQAAADLVQQVLLSTLESLRSGRLREPDRLISFVFGTCRQVVIDQRRTQQRRERILETFIEDVPSGAVADLPRSSDSRLEPCLQELPERERSVLLLTFYGERPAREIAEQFGLSEGNIRVIRHRGLRSLRDCVTREPRLA